MSSDLLSRIRVVLSHPRHPGNIGATARAMKTMGLSRLVLVNPLCFPDPQADSLASNAADLLAEAQVVTRLEDALTGCLFATAVTARRRELAVEPLWARDAAAELASFAQGGEVALVFGNEKSGLSNEEVALCQRWTTIPTNSESSSLNLSQAVQVLCYELRQAAIDPGLPPLIAEAGVLATHEEVEGLLVHLEQASIRSGFLDPEQPKRLMQRVRRLFGRCRLERKEVDILRGMIAALENPRPRS